LPEQERCYWWEAAPLEEPGAGSPASPDVAPECDVAIVGAGYTGLSAALVLARAGRSVQVFDKERPGEGASSRNGGMASGSLQFGLGGLIERVGEARAVAIFKEGKAARELLARTIAEEGIDCDFRLTGRFTGAARPAHYEGFGREADLLNRHLDIGAEPVPRARQHEEIGSDLYHGGMLRPDIGGLHPAKLHAGLLGLARRAGAAVHGRTPVQSVARRADGPGFVLTVARAGRQHRVTAGRVIMAVNAYTDGADGWLRRRMVPARSRIIATAPLSPNLMASLMPRGRMMGNTRKLFNYFRPSPDGTRILLGGRDTSDASEAGGEDRPGNTDALRRDLVGIFPVLDGVEITHSWAGRVAFSRRFLPAMFRRDGVVYACGYCGSGVVWATWLGRKAGLALLDDPEGETALADTPPPAVPLFDGRPWFMPAVHLWYGLKDRFG